ncbi:hypothetical protein BCUE_0861 [Candidatus Kinetoplastibacterium blastocrithidii TCC012E]|uniref:DUF721 domain-containing protein n=2 Tax=Candidatus Kinetoplastidibacterium blastocrithidiae TaxID=233181 RepID=M1ME34_9PROT|nr:DUF721 domain-containing protein [Candidatus Kinetoplastibacterium blastocrithidii]AGF49990.1 hypothetical protein BCUE_0861 [Candidatus Kinetoplastibacterium blastocrithidii TCC012E]
MNSSKQTNSHNYKAIDWLRSNRKINETLVTAYNYIKIKQLVSTVLPEYLKNSFHIIKTEQNSITIAVDGATYATRIRQLSPSILNKIKTTYSLNLEIIKIKIINNCLASEIKIINKQKNYISNNTIKYFEQLREKSKPGPLKDAIEKLIEHHKS